MRRDIAMLGILFKVSRGIAPSPIQSMFSLRPSNLDAYGFASGRSRHSRQIMDPVCPSHGVCIKRSIFGLIRVFNLLPQTTVDAISPKAFQRRLQFSAKQAAELCTPEWECMYRPHV